MTPAGARAGPSTKTLEIGWQRIIFIGGACWEEAASPQETESPAHELPPP